MINGLTSDLAYSYIANMNLVAGVSNAVLWSDKFCDLRGRLIDVSAFSASSSVNSFNYVLASSGRGIPRKDARTTNSPFLLSGSYLSSETGFYYYGCRYLDTGNGRWLSRDPIAEAGSAMLYGFAENNGINAFDPYGLSPSYDATDPTTWKSWLPDPSEGYWVKGRPGEGVFKWHKGSYWADMFPKGVRYIKGMADFSKYTRSLVIGGKKLKGVAEVMITGNSSADIAKAFKQFAEQNRVDVKVVQQMVDDMELMWHHNADGRMILVPKAMNALPHVGYAAYARWAARTALKQSGRYMGCIVVVFTLIWDDPAQASIEDLVPLPGVGATEISNEDTRYGAASVERRRIVELYRNRYEMTFRDRLELLRRMRNGSIYQETIYLRTFINAVPGNPDSEPIYDYLRVPVSPVESLDEEILDLLRTLRGR